MGDYVTKYAALIAIALLSIVPVGFAQSNTASMNLTGAGSNILDGVYTGPYTATINGVSTQVVCDDWVDESFVGDSWTADVNSLQPLSNPSETKYGNNQLVYDQAAWLVTAMENPGTTCTYSADCVGDISFALWELPLCKGSTLSSCPTTTGYPFSYLSGNDLANAQSWLSQALAMSSVSDFTTGEFSNFQIYTPNNANHGPPQEFLVEDAASQVTTAAESPTLLLLGTDLFGLLALVIVFRRRIVRTAP